MDQKILGFDSLLFDIKFARQVAQNKVWRGIYTGCIPAGTTTYLITEISAWSLL